MDDNIKLEVVNWGGKGTPLVFLAGSELNHLGRYFPERVKGLIYMDSHLAVCPNLGYATIEVLKHQDNSCNIQRVKGSDVSYLPYADLSVLGKLITEEEERHYSAIAAPAIAISHIPEQKKDFFIGLGNPTQKCFEKMNKLTYLGIASFIKDKQNADVAAIQNNQHLMHADRNDVFLGSLVAYFYGLKTFD